MRRSTLILSALLALSVAVNMLLGGVVIGQRWKASPERAQLFDRSLGAVPPDLHRPIRERLRATEPSIRTRLQGAGEARREVAEALRARPFDRAAAEAALNRLRGAVDGAQIALHTAILDVMEEAQARGELPPPPERPRRRGAEDGPPPPDRTN